MRFRSQWFFRPFNKFNGFFSPDAPKPFQYTTWFPKTSQTFSSHLFYYPGNSWDWNFFLLYQSCHFLLSKVILMPLWLIIWCLPNKGRSFRDSCVFKRSMRWTVILLTFSCFEISVLLKPASSKVDISILLVLIRRYLTFCNFYRYKEQL